MENNKTYLGDGVYCFSDGWHAAVLETERDTGMAQIFLGDAEMQNLFRFLERTCGVKITIEKVKDERQTEFTD